MLGVTQKGLFIRGAQLILRDGRDSFQTGSY